MKNTLKKYLFLCNGYKLFRRLKNGGEMSFLPETISEKICDVIFNNNFDEKSLVVRKTEERLYPFKKSANISKIIDYALIALQDSKEEAISHWNSKIKEAKERKRRYMNFISQKITPVANDCYKNKLADSIVLRYSSLTNGMVVKNDDIDLLVFSSTNNTKKIAKKFISNLRSHLEGISLLQLQRSKAMELNRIYTFFHHEKKDRYPLEIWITDPEKNLNDILKEREYPIEFYKKILPECRPLVGEKEFNKWKNRILEAE